MFRDLLLGSFAASGGALFSQGPAFVQQYLQRLGGALRELERLTERTPRIDSRILELRSAHDALAAADPIAKPFVALRHLKPEIALDALRVFEPALPLSLGGLVYAATGVAMAVLLFNLALWPFRSKQRHDAFD